MTRSFHCGPAALRLGRRIANWSLVMRAEAQTLVTEIEESLELLRRRL